MAVEQQQRTRGEREAERLEAELVKLDENVDRDAEKIREARDRAVETVERNTELNELAKKQRLDQARDTAKEHMSRLKQEYLDSRNAAIEGTRSYLFGSAPSGSKDPAKLMAFRDARDRAARLEDSHAAEHALRQALEVGDSEQAEAIVSHAYEKGWGNVWRAHPDLAAGVDRLARLRHDRPNTMFRFTI